MKKIICNNREEIGKAAAEIVLAQMKRKPDSILGFATGSSPIPLYNSLIELCKKSELDFSRVTSFNLDEYYPIKRENDQSYYYFMWDNLFSHVNIKRENVNILNGEAADPAGECRAYDEKIEKMGGIDLQILGIGHNGHIGFNEPAEFLSADTHMVTLTESTIKANSIYFKTEDEMPKSALTLGLGGIMKAKKIIVVINGSSKAQAVRRLFDRRVGTDCPGSILNLHNDVTVILDNEAAELI